MSKSYLDRSTSLRKPNFKNYEKLKVPCIFYIFLACSVDDEDNSGNNQQEANVFQIINTSNAQILSNSINRIRKGSNGTMYVATDKGLSWYDGEWDSLHIDAVNLNLDIEWEDDINLLISNEHNNIWRFNTNNKELQVASDVESIFPFRNLSNLDFHIEDGNIYVEDEFLSPIPNNENEECSSITLVVDSIYFDSEITTQVSELESLSSYHSYPTYENLGYESDSEIPFTFFSEVEYEVCFILSVKNESNPSAPLCYTVTGGIPALNAESVVIKKCRQNSTSEDVVSEIIYQLPNNELHTTVNSVLAPKVIKIFKNIDGEIEGFFRDGWFRFTSNTWAQIGSINEYITSDIDVYNLKNTNYITNKNFVAYYNGSNWVKIFDAPEDCWIFGNQEVQDLRCIDDIFLVTSCEHIAQCKGANCRTFSFPEAIRSLFPLRSNTIEVFDEEHYWVGFEQSGIVQITIPRF